MESEGKERAVTRTRELFGRTNTHSFPNLGGVALDMAAPEALSRGYSLGAAGGAGACAPLSGCAAATCVAASQPLSYWSGPLNLSAARRGQLFAGRRGGRRMRGGRRLEADGDATVGRQLAAPGKCARGSPDWKPVGFVHVNKAGGTAMIAILGKHSRPQMLQFTSPQALAKLRSIRSRFFHASAALQQWAVGEAAWRDAYRFALVRNPWARQVSMFHFLLETASCAKPCGQRAAHCDKRLLPQAGPWLASVDLATPRFRAWIRDMAAAFPPGHPQQHLFGARFHGNERDAWYNASQISWMVDGRGAVLVDDIFKLEELQQHWPTLQRRVCSLRGVPYADGGLRKNPSMHAHYSRYYDDQTRRIVAQYMQADIDRFGYTFEQQQGGG